MARYTGPVCRICRREGTKLYLKGERCTSGKCAFDRRSQVPGQHYDSRKKVGEYGMHLREKQKVRRYYGLLEKQFRNYFEMADKKPGMTGENLLVILESRLDNVVYRMGMASSRKEARQLVLHNHFRVNGKKANIPSILVKAGDVVTINESSTDSAKIKELLEECASKHAPKWLDVNTENGTAKVVTLPAREDIDFEINEQLIVEFYSK
ncbi:MAG: 30S ribosomal protein S4 [Clostridia bacterium]|nr:30S ribosomal protein S4 [Clostridia bacterium]